MLLKLMKIIIGCKKNFYPNTSFYYALIECPTYRNADTEIGKSTYYVFMMYTMQPPKAVNNQPSLEPTYYSKDHSYPFQPE